jgi:hypothetical protein
MRESIVIELESLVKLPLTGRGSGRGSHPCNESPSFRFSPLRSNRIVFTSSPYKAPIDINRSTFEAILDLLYFIYLLYPLRLQSSQSYRILAVYPLRSALHSLKSRPHFKDKNASFSHLRHHSHRAAVCPRRSQEAARHPSDTCGRM